MAQARRIMGHKCFRYVVDHYSYNEHSFNNELNKYVLVEGSRGKDVIDEVAPLLMHAKLFWEPFRNGMCLADCWESDGWRGLNNDERTMMVLRRATYPVILEIQNKINDTATLCVDQLDPEKKPFTVFDRNTAARYGRFSRSVTRRANPGCARRINPGFSHIQTQNTCIGCI